MFTLPHPVKSFRASRQRRRRRRSGTDPEANGGTLDPEKMQEMEMKKRRLEKAYGEINKNGLEVAVIIAMPSPRCRTAHASGVSRTDGVEDDTTAIELIHPQPVKAGEAPSHVVGSSDSTPTLDFVSAASLSSSSSHIESGLGSGLHEFALGLTNVKLDRDLVVT